MRSIGVHSGRYRAARFTALIVAFAAGAQANPSLSIQVEGECPTQVELVAALAAKGFEQTGERGRSSHVVTSRSGLADAVLQLADHSGETLLERRFSSQDCHALAEAMAVVVESHFVEVGVLKQPTRIETQSQRATENVDQLSQPTQLLQMATTAAIPIKPPAKAPLPATANTPIGAVSPTSADSRSTTLFRGFAGIGPKIELPKTVLNSEFELGGGVDSTRVPIATEFVVASSWPTISGARPDRVWRWASQGLLRFGVPWAGDLCYRPWVGVGVAVARLRELDLQAATAKLTASPIAGAGLDMSWPIGRGWLGRVDVGCLVLGRRDAYHVNPTGEIGLGPRVTCSVMFGVARGGRSFAP